MRIFKATYKDRNGRRRESRDWYVEFKDQRGIIRRVPASPDKAAAGECGRCIGRLVALKVQNNGPDAELARWLETIPARLRDYLARIGLLDALRVTAAKSLAQHLADFSQAIEDRGSTATHAAKTVQRAARCFDALGFKHWQEVEAGANRVAAWLREQQQAGAAAQTVNYYRQAMAQFGRWMVRERRAAEHPFANLPRFNVIADRRRERRALEVDEIRALLAATETGPERFSMPGPERALLYRLALETGLRANELRTLRRLNFQLDTDQAAVTVEARNAKNRRSDTLPLRPDTAAQLREHLRLKMPDAPAFGMAKNWRSAEMLAQDLKGAGVEAVDPEGRVVDFHALRHTFVTMLARSGVHPNTAKSLARHSTITLTMDRYSHVRRDDEVEALRRLPAFEAAPAQAATGTAGIPGQGDSRLAFCLASGGGANGQTVELSGDVKAVHNSREAPASAGSKTAPQAGKAPTARTSKDVESGGRGGSRTHTLESQVGILSPLRLPFRHSATC